MRLHPLTKLGIGLVQPVRGSAVGAADRLTCYGGLWTISEIAALLDIAPIPSYALGYRGWNVAYRVHGDWAYETLKRSRSVGLGPLQKAAVLEATYIY